MTKKTVDDEKYNPVTIDDKWFNEALSKPGVRKAYDALEEEYSLLNAMLAAREEAGLTQAQLAKKIGRKQPSIARVERTLADPNGSISFAFLRDYAKACGKKVEVRFID